jgi:hypothetical protein
MGVIQTPVMTSNNCLDGEGAHLVTLTVIVTDEKNNIPVTATVRVTVKKLRQCF